MRISNEWALDSNGSQWILQHRRRHTSGGCWRPVCFVRSTRKVLERCMRDKGVPDEDARCLLEGLPASFDSWIHRISAEGLSPQTPGQEEADSNIDRRASRLVSATTEIKPQLRASNDGWPIVTPTVAGSSSYGTQRRPSPRS
jgi:hypothetical protein